MKKALSIILMIALLAPSLAVGGLDDNSLLKTRYGIVSTPREINYSDGVSSGIQAQIDGISSGPSTFLNATIVDGIMNGVTEIEGELDLNDGIINDVGYIDLNLIDGVDQAEGRLTWNDDDGTANLGMKGGIVNLQIGQEVIARVKNVEGSQIDNGMVVYVSGASGANVEVRTAIANDISTAPRTFAIATENILNNQLGYVTLIGNVRDIPTSGAPEGETWNDGDILYLSAATKGDKTNVRPIPPDIAVVVGVVMRAHASEGVVSVKPIVVQRHSLSSDVLISSIADNDLTYWDTDVWKNAGLSEIGTALTQGSVLFINSGTMISEDNPNLSYDDTSDLLNVPSMTATGDTFVQGSSGPYGEFIGENLTTLTLGAGVWANIPGVTDGLFTTGMALNNGTGCQTVTYGGVYEATGSISYADPDSNSESYHFSYTIDGAEQEKCESHTDITVLSSHEAVPVTCLLNLSANEEVCAAVVSVGGDDIFIEHINWYLKR